VQVDRQTERTSKIGSKSREFLRRYRFSYRQSSW